MKLAAFFSIFIAVFLAELGDKTQLATMLFSAKNQESKLWVFTAASLALIASSAVAVLAGGLVGQAISPRVLKTVAGIGFIIIGIWTLFSPE